MNRNEMIEKITSVLDEFMGDSYKSKYYAKILFDNGIRSADGFEIGWEKGKDLTQVIKPKEYKETT